MSCVRGTGEQPRGWPRRSGNDNPELRAYALTPSARFYDGQHLTGSPALREVSRQRFVAYPQDRPTGSTQPASTPTFRGGRIIEVTETYLA